MACTGHSNSSSCQSHDNSGGCNSHATNTGCTSHTNACPEHTGYIGKGGAISLTDVNFIPGRMVKADHINQLRSLIDEVRTRWNKPSMFASTPNVVPNDTIIIRDHIKTLRNGINEVKPKTWQNATDANIDNTDNVVATHMQEIVDYVVDINNTCGCNCNYSCTCNCNYGCTCNCNYGCTCQCNYSCTCNCNYACVCNCNYACVCNCNYACVCNCNYACTCQCAYAYHF